MQILISNKDLTYFQSSELLRFRNKRARPGVRDPERALRLPEGQVHGPGEEGRAEQPDRSCPGCQSVLRRRRPFRQTRTLKLDSGFRSHEHPVVAPQVMHLRQVPLRTRVKLPHSEHESPS